MAPVELVSRPLPRSVASAARPQAAAGTRTEWLWAFALSAAGALILATDLLAPQRFGGGSLVVLPVLAASWVLGRRALIAVQRAVRGRRPYSRSPACVTVELRPRDPVEVAVHDLGQGIPAEHHDRVFERFHRVEATAYRPGGGLGLGLSVSRELARLNGGALELERSSPGRGSVFVLRLPSHP